MPALAVALIGLAVALGGTGYAVTQLPRNSVGTAQIKNNAVTGAKVRNGSLTAADFRRGTLLQGAAGLQGPAGPQGATGPQGPAGAQGPAGPTASAAAAFTAPTGALAIALSGTSIVALSPTSGVSSGPVRVVQSSRIVANATVRIRNDAATPTAGCFVRCRLGFKSVDASTWLPPLFSDETSGTWIAPYTPGANPPTTATAPTVTLALTGAFDATPGTYDGQVECECDTDPVSHLPLAERADLTVVATAA